MTILYALRMIPWLLYFFGYMIVYLPVLRRGEKALAEGDTATVRALVEKHVPHWCAMLLKIGGIRAVVEGQENIPAGRACVFVANHRSYTDIPVMLTALGAPYGLLAKQELNKLPLVNRWMRLLGCVFVQRDDVRASMKALNTATETVKNGCSFTVFPEGTRHKGAEGTVGEFKGGAFRIAVKNGAPLVPVALGNTRACFENAHHLVTNGVVTVKILPAIETAGLTRDEQKNLPELTRQRIEAALQA